MIQFQCEALLTLISPPLPSFQVEEVLQESAEMPKSRPSMADRYIQPELPEQGKSPSLIEAVTTMRSKLNIF